jgi:23S rRNA-/tRNA-specific pseudouridylate synthase
MKIRLHKYIKDLVSASGLEYTNPEIQRNIQKLGVIVDGQKVFKRLEWVYPEQTFDITHWPIRDTGNFKEVKILYQDNTYMVVFKPVNVVMQPGAGHQQNNLQVYFKDQFNQNWLPVNRLDKNTQGLVMFALGGENQKFFQDQFRNRTVKKKYLAVVDKVVDNLLIVENYQTRDKLQPTRQSVVFTDLEKQKARLARSRFKPIFYSQQLQQTLLEIEIFSGRMHQIRLQCESLGFPISQDSVYNSKTLDKKYQDKIIKSSVLSSPKPLSAESFKQLQTKIFSQSEHNLLSNYLEFTDQKKQRISFELHDPNSFI